MSLTFKTGKFEDAKKVRIAVFVDEQGFKDEFDKIDEHPEMIHVTAYDEAGELIGCARVFSAALEPHLNDAPGRWVFGRLAVLPDKRKGGLGSQILAASERIALDNGATEIHLHAQCDKMGFYERNGYVGYGPTDYDEHVEHRWMVKQFNTNILSAASSVESASSSFPDKDLTLASSAKKERKTSSNFMKKGTAAVQKTPACRDINEDDDGYHPYADRVEPTPLFEEDPWR